MRFPGKATAVVGMRRAGKTTFLHQLRDERIEQGVARQQLPYVSFEDERLANLEAADLDLLVSEYGREFADVDDAALVVWHFDEIQVVPGWERFVRRLLDAERTEVIVTGSSAALLSARGRDGPPGARVARADSSVQLRRGAPPPGRGASGLMRRSSRAGSGPGWSAPSSTGSEPAAFPRRKGSIRRRGHQLLRDYVDVAMLRDVVERHDVRNVTSLRWLVRHLLGNAGGMFSIEKFHAALKSQGIPIARDTLHHFLGYLGDCFLVRIVWMESVSERQRMVNPRKAYPVDRRTDPGLRPDRPGQPGPRTRDRRFSWSWSAGAREVTYVRTPEGYEVDFLARDATGETELIQVCADLSDPATAKRECRALAAAGKLFPRARRRLLTLTQDGLPADPPTGTEMQSACEWLLQGVR